MEPTTSEYINEVIKSIDERINEAEGILKFLKSQKAAAIEQRDGKAPVNNYYIVASRSGGDDHRIRRDGTTGEFTCTCPAALSYRDCWAKKGVMMDTKNGVPTLGWFRDDRAEYRDYGYSTSSWYTAKLALLRK